MHEVQPFVAHGEPTKAMQPREGAFNDPARAAETTAMRCPARGELCRDPAARELIPMRLRVVAPVTLHQVGLGDRAPRPPPQRRNAVDQRQQLGDVVPVGGRQARDERDAVRVREDVVFAARFTAIGGVRSRFFPPRNARTDALSTTVRARSSWPRRRSSASSTSWIRCHTPALCHATSRRQQTVPDPQPISRGSMFHGMPLRSTNRMPVRTARSGIGLRPAYRRFRGGRTGSTGSIRTHRASSRSGLVIRDRLPVGHAKVPRHDQKYKS